MIDRRIFVLTGWLALVPGQAGAIVDDVCPTIVDAADIASRRTQLYTLIWGYDHLPTTLPTVTNCWPSGPCMSNGVSTTNPFPTWNIARVDNYHTVMSNGQTNDSLFYWAGGYPVPNSQKVVILNAGHEDGDAGTCDWPTFFDWSRMKTILQDLLAAGYNVFAENMPMCGSLLHANLFNTYGSTAMGYFLEPAIAARNYWDAHYSFQSYNRAGVSGGGWMGLIDPALDQRNSLSFSVAGGDAPGIWWDPNIHCWLVGNCPDNANVTGDHVTENDWTPVFTIAGFADMAIMASWGGGGRQLYEVKNFDDHLIDGNQQYIALGAPAVKNMSWLTYTSQNMSNVKNHPAVPHKYTGVIDFVAPAHQISTQAEAKMLELLAAPPPSQSSGGAVRVLGRR